MNTIPELLAPAGDMEALHTAYHFGADAVYAGGPMLQLRADKASFTRSQLTQAAEIAHRLDKRFYVTVNSFVYDDELDALPEYARFLREIGVHGAIVSDIGALDVMKQSAPELSLHISTQANCMNAAAAKVYAKLGASRIVLARELQLPQIRRLRADLPSEIELEAFVHGAMCMAYSGRCLLSAYFNNRSANRGDCSQPCRWRYHVQEETRKDVYLPVEESEKGTAIFSAQDLCCISILDQLTDAGIASFKIEGRMKTPFYTATVVNAYRRALNGDVPLPALERELSCLSHRPYSTGFYFGEVKKTNPNVSGYLQQAVFVGVVREIQSGMATIEQRNRFIRGERLEVISPHSFGESFTVTTIYDASGNAIEQANHPQQMVTVPCASPLFPGDFLRRVET